MTLDTLFEPREQSRSVSSISGVNTEQEVLGTNQEEALRDRSYRLLGEGSYANHVNSASDSTRRLQDYLRQNMSALGISLEKEGDITHACIELTGNVPKHAVSSMYLDIALFESRDYLKVVVRDYAGDVRILDAVRRARNNTIDYESMDPEAIMNLMLEKVDKGTMGDGMNILKSTADAVVYSVIKGQSTTVTAYFKKDAMQDTNQERIAA